MKRFVYIYQKVCLFGCGIAVSLHAAAPLGIVGGKNGSSPYVAHVTDTSGTVKQITLPSAFDNGDLFGCAMNSTGLSFIVSYAPSFCAFVLPEGSVSSAIPLTNSGKIKRLCAAINESGTGLVWGNNYAAFLTQNSQQPTQINVPNQAIGTGAINNAGTILLGGQSISTPYAARVNPGATTLQPITLGVSGDGMINSVAINESGMGFIGGSLHGSNDKPYAARLDSGSVSTSNIFDASATGNIYSIAINGSGRVLIGGTWHGPQQSFSAAFIEAGTNIITPVGPRNPDPEFKEVRAVAINNSGVGLIGGSQKGDDSRYAARVTLSESQPIIPPGGVIGNITSVAINDAGIGLIADPDNAPYYAALVAADNTLTELSGAGYSSNTTQIYALSLAGAGGGGDGGGGNNNPILKAIMPEATGSYSGPIYTQFAASNTLELRLSQALWPNSGQTGELTSLVAGPTPAQYPVKNTSSYAMWATPFGNYITLKAEGSAPAYENTIGGGLAGFDYHCPTLVLGGALGYAFNYMHYSQNGDHGTLQEELACFYTAYKTGPVWWNAALWGGLYQMHNKRLSLGFISSTASTQGWLLSPHLEITVCSGSSHCRIEPFAKIDWATNWQRPYTEQGKSGLNLVMPSLWSSLLQSELGLRMYVLLDYAWGRFLLQEKFGYVNQTPFHVNNAQTFFIGAASSFPVATGSSKTHNLGSIQFLCAFLPTKWRIPDITLDLEGQFGSTYQSYFSSIELCRNF